MPPLNLFLLVGVFWGATRVFRLHSKLAVLTILSVAYLVCTPIVGQAILATHQTFPPLSKGDLPGRASGIVVLSAGLGDRAPEYGGLLLDGFSLRRTTYAGFLQNSSGLPLMVSGGTIRQSAPPLSHLMADFLTKQLRAKVRWVEDQSTSTWENAKYAAEILRREHVQRIYLVTHAWHMPRAVYAFQEHGIEVVPAPTGFVSIAEPTLRALLPSHAGLSASYYGLHEWFGRIAYRLLKNVQRHE